MTSFLSEKGRNSAPKVFDSDVSRGRDYVALFSIRRKGRGFLELLVDFHPDHALGSGVLGSEAAKDDALCQRVA